MRLGFQKLSSGVPGTLWKALCFVEVRLISEVTWTTLCSTPFQSNKGGYHRSQRFCKPSASYPTISVTSREWLVHWSTDALIAPVNGSSGFEPRYATFWQQEDNKMPKKHRLHNEISVCGISFAVSCLCNSRLLILADQLRPGNVVSTNLYVKRCVMVYVYRCWSLEDNLVPYSHNGPCHHAIPKAQIATTLTQYPLQCPMPRFEQG